MTHKRYRCVICTKFFLSDKTEMTTMCYDCMVHADCCGLDKILGETRNDVQM